MNSSQSLSLYKIANEYQSLLNQLYDQETGEINEEVQEQIDALEPSAEKNVLLSPLILKKWRVINEKLIS